MSEVTRWVVFGAGGMLGTEVVNLLQGKGYFTVPLTRAEADVTDASSVAQHIAAGDVVVNCAAWTRVDDAEAHRAAAFAVNAEGPRHLAQACSATGATLVHLSTDYVFGDAPSGTPIREDAPLSPRCAYGESKAAGEQAIREILGNRAIILRTAWLYGAHGRNFVSTIRGKLREGQELHIVDDQVGQPTWAHDVARVIADAVQHERTGTHHATATGHCSWYQLALAIAELEGHDVSRIHAIPSSEYPTPAERPRWSVLAHTSGLTPLPHWRESLAHFLRTTPA